MYWHRPCFFKQRTFLCFLYQYSESPSSAAAIYEQEQKYDQVNNLYLKSIEMSGELTCSLPYHESPSSCSMCNTRHSQVVNPTFSAFLITNSAQMGPLEPHVFTSLHFTSAWQMSYPVSFHYYPSILQSAVFIIQWEGDSIVKHVVSSLVSKVFGCLGTRLNCADIYHMSEPHPHWNDVNTCFRLPKPTQHKQFTILCVDLEVIIQVLSVPLSL